MMGEPGPTRPCGPASLGTRPELPPPVPPVTFELSRVRSRDRRARLPSTRTRRPKHPLLQPSLDEEQGPLQPDPRSTSRPHGEIVNRLVWGMDRQTLDTYGLADEEMGGWGPSAPSRLDRVQEWVQEQSDMIMDVDQDESEANGAPTPISVEMMRLRRKCTRRGRPIARPHSSDIADAQFSQPLLGHRKISGYTTQPPLSQWHSPSAAGAVEVERKDAPTSRNHPLLPLRRKYMCRSQPLRDQDASPQPRIPSPTNQYAHDTPTQGLPAWWHEPALVADCAEKPTCPDLEPDEGYCEGADDMTWLAEAGVMVDGLPSNGRLRFKTSAETAMQCSVVVQKIPRMRRRRQRKIGTRSMASQPVTDASVDMCKSSMLPSMEVSDAERLLGAPVSRRMPSDATAQEVMETATTTEHGEH